MLIGIVLMVIFLVTSSAGRGDPLTLLAGAAVSALGLLLRRRRQQESSGSGRFQTLRRMMGEDVPSEDEEL